MSKIHINDIYEVLGQEVLIAAHIEKSLTKYLRYNILTEKYIFEARCKHFKFIHETDDIEKAVQIYNQKQGG